MMKQTRFSVFLIMAMAVAMGAGTMLAAEGAALTRSQWLKKIGASVTSDAVLRETLGQVAPEEKVEFTQRVLKAVTRMPVSPEEKAAVFVRTAVACIASVAGEMRYKVIAEIFADVPVEYLPVVMEELAKRFDQEYNKLSDEQYEKIASAALTAAFARNAQTDAPSVRDTFAILAFLRGSKTPAALQDKLLALLPDDRMRGLAASWIPPALKERNYEALLAAADVNQVYRSNTLVLVGHSALHRLLADLNSGEPLSSIVLGSDTNNLAASPKFHGNYIERRNVEHTTSSGFRGGGGNTDGGFSSTFTIPRGYQNQTINIGR
jgi:hypothetical protein